MRLTVEQGRFVLNGQPSLLRFGEMHYFRIHPDLWRPSLTKLKEAGLNGICTYIPWVWHEPEEGHLDLTGTTHPARNLFGFIEACRDAGFLLMVRPGPFIYAEYNGLGHPLWLGQSYPETLVRQPDGRPGAGNFWFNYSLGHPTYRQKVAGWYGSILPALKPYENDPVVAVQIDNETGLMYANAEGMIDWNPDTVERFRIFLQQKYPSIGNLNRVWGSSYDNWEVVNPPLSPFTQAHLTEWQSFLESWLTDYLTWLAGTARMQTRLPLFHNEQGCYSSPANPRLKQGIFDFYGYDNYLKSSGTPHAADFPFASSIVPELFNGITSRSNPHFVAEMGVGWFDPRSRVPEMTVVQNILGAVAHGLKGMCLYTVHDCEETDGTRYCYHSLLDVTGQPDGKYGAAQSVMAFLRENEPLLLDSEAFHDSVATLAYFPTSRSTKDDFIFRRKLRDPARFLRSQGQYGTHALLLASGFNPAVVDLETADSEALARYKVLFFPNNGYIDPGSYGKLAAYVEGGGTLITLPDYPTHDLHGRPFDTSALYPAPEIRRRLPGRARLLIRVLLRWGLHYRARVRRGLAENHQYSMHLIDLFEPALTLITAPLKPVRLQDESRHPVRGDFQCTEFVPRIDTETVLRTPAGKVAGYSFAFGKGRSLVLGTVPGGSLCLPAYYRLSSKELDSLCSFMRNLMSGFGVEPGTGTGLPIEISYRTSGGRTLAFVINRGKARSGYIAFDRRICEGAPEKLFSYGGSMFRPAGLGEWQVELAADDVLVLAFKRTKA